MGDTPPPGKGVRCANCPWRGSMIAVTVGGGHPVSKEAPTPCAHPKIIVDDEIAHTPPGGSPVVRPAVVTPPLMSRATPLERVSVRVGDEPPNEPRLDALPAGDKIQVVLDGGGVFASTTITKVSALAFADRVRELALKR